MKNNAEERSFFEPTNKVDFSVLKTYDYYIYDCVLHFEYTVFLELLSPTLEADTIDYELEEME